MFITKKKHDAVIAARDETIAELRKESEYWQDGYNEITSVNASIHAELATFRANRERSNANLTAANAKRKAEAQAKAA